MRKRSEPSLKVATPIPYSPDDVQFMETSVLTIEDLLKPVVGLHKGDGARTYRVNGYCVKIWKSSK